MSEDYDEGDCGGLYPKMTEDYTGGLQMINKEISEDEARRFLMMNWGFLMIKAGGYLKSMMKEIADDYIRRGLKIIPEEYDEGDCGGLYPKMADDYNKGIYDDYARRWQMIGLYIDIF